MSIKLYYGLRSDKTLNEIYNELVEFRNKYVRVESNQIISMSRYLEQQEKITNIEDKLYNSSFLVIPRDGYVLGYPYFSDMLKMAILDQPLGSSWMDIFLKLTSFYEYGYWDNTDMPDHVTEEEWEEREEAWSVVDYRPMIFQGFSFELSDPIDFIKLV